MVGKRIKKYLDENGIKQSFVYQKIGMSKDRFSAICNGTRKIEASEYNNICKTLNVPLEQFFED